MSFCVAKNNIPVQVTFLGVPTNLSSILIWQCSLACFWNQVVTTAADDDPQLRLSSQRDARSSWDAAMAHGTGPAALMRWLLKRCWSGEALVVDRTGAWANQQTSLGVTTNSTSSWMNWWGYFPGIASFLSWKWWSFVVNLLKILTADEQQLPTH